MASKARLYTFRLAVPICIAFVLISSSYYKSLIHRLWYATLPDESLPSYNQERLHEFSSPSKPNNGPIVVYRNSVGRVRACVIPGLCTLEPFTGFGTEYHVPERYRESALVLRECYSQGKMKFYSGEQPNYQSVTTYDVDVLGRALVSTWYEHFAHLAKLVLCYVLPPASLFREPGIQTLRNAKCHYPGAKTATPCRNSPLRNVKPRILVSHHVYNLPWNRDLFDILSSLAGRKANQEPLLHFVSDVVNPTHMHMECVRTGLTTATGYDSKEEGKDSLLRKAGVTRAPVCNRKPHVVVIFRKQGFKRAPKFATLKALREQLPNQLAKSASIEWQEGLYIPFREQIALFQRADVLVSIHGAELSNVLFMRHDARIIEIMPFGYMDRWFYWLATSVHVKVIPFPSDPDPEKFHQCISKQSESASLAIKLNTLVARFQNSTTWEQRRNVALDAPPSDDKFSQCAREQHIAFNVEKLSQLIKAQVSERRAAGCKSYL